MPRAVRFEQYGGVEVLNVVDVDPPEPGDGQLLVRVKAAGINPFESKLRSGLFQGEIPLSFPAAEGSDLAGVVEAVGPNVDAFGPGDEVLGTTTKRGSHAELALTSQSHVVARPAELPWEVAGGLWTVATTAYGTVAAISPGAGELVIVAGASGGVGGLAAQLARHRGASVIGVAAESGHAWLRSRGIEPLAYGDGLAERVKEAAAAQGRPIAALIDTVGRGYVELALDLGITPDRIDTIADYEAGSKYGVKTDGAGAGANPEVVEGLVQLVVGGDLELPVAATFPLEQVREAYALLEGSHPPGKIVLIP
jgi:NADPH:quinone reductase-like Zn-dependent oxidoreductase